MQFFRVNYSSRVDLLKEYQKNILLCKVEIHQVKYSFPPLKMKIPLRYPLNLGMLVVVRPGKSSVLQLTRGRKISGNHQSPFLGVLICCGILHCLATVIGISIWFSQSGYTNDLVTIIYSRLGT